MIPRPFGYIAVILCQQLIIVGLAWYVIRLLDRARRERRRQASTLASSDASASCDLAALAAKLSPVSAERLDSSLRPANAQVRQTEGA
jgi:hypothetical protein